MRTLIVLLLAMSFLVGSGAQANDPASLSPFEVNLRALADFFFPAKSLAVFTEDACRTAYRTKLQRTASDVELERAIPGIHNQMVSAAGEYCDRETGQVFAERQAKIISDWRSAISPADLQRFVELFHEETEQALDTHIGIREGETAKDAVARVFPLPASERKAFERKQQKFAATPAGARLLDRISQYQSKLKQETDSGQWFTPLIKAAMARAHVAANEFAEKKGFTHPYPGE